MADLVFDFAKECKAIAHVDGGAGVLCCWGPIGHDGPHQDKADGIWWSTDFFNPPGTPGAGVPDA